MREDYAYIACIIDQSGSMYHLRQDTIGGINSFIEEQKNVAGEATLRINLFNTKMEQLYNGDLKDAPEFTEAQYLPSGGTALYDAIGLTVDALGKELALIPEDERPGKVIVMILTDGEENSSNEYTDERIKEMVEHQERVYNWEFIFLGANQDSFTTAGGIGIRANNTMNWMPTSDGVTEAYTSLSNYARTYRTSNG